jgi:argininosuccinate lyase
MMPNKVNPDAMELLRGECALVTSAHGQAVMLLKGLPSGYNRDLQCIKPLVRDALVKLDAMATMALRFLMRLDFNAEELAKSMALGQITATLRMESKVKSGMALREAHHAVAEEVRSSPEAVAQRDALTAAEYATVGSASPAETRRVADEILKGLDSC